jgi:hypothetical protein
VGGGVILATVMDEMNTALDTIDGLRCFPFPADNIAPPASIVGYPTEVTYDTTMGRGVDSLVIPIFVLVARITDRTARDALGAYLDGSGAKSVKAVVQAGTYTQAVQVRVASAEVQVVTVAGVDYLAAVFTVQVYGTGS